MFKKSLIVFIAAAGVLLNSCGKKTVPSKTAKVTVEDNSTVNSSRKVKPAPTPPKPDSVTVEATPEEKTATKTGTKTFFSKSDHSE